MHKRRMIAAVTMVVAAGLVVAYFKLVVADPTSIRTSAGPRWDWGRVDGQRGLVIGFVGGDPVERPAFCDPTYSARVVETISEVVISLKSHELRSKRRGGGFCTLVGHFRTVRVTLREPLAGRVVRDGNGKAIREVLRSKLLTPSFIPARLTNHSAGSAGGAWYQIWRDPENDDCSVSLTQGPPGSGAASELEIIDDEPVLVRGATARFVAVADDVREPVGLRWESDGQSFVMRTSSLCRSTLVRKSLLVRMAQSLR